MDDKIQTNVRLTEGERRALKMLAGALGVSISEFTSEAIQKKWNEKFPDMEYPDENGNIKPKKGQKK